jgi:hypothetical protein
LLGHRLSELGFGKLHRRSHALALARAEPASRGFARRFQDLGKQYGLEFLRGFHELLLILFSARGGVRRLHYAR